MCIYVKGKSASVCGMSREFSVFQRRLAYFVLVQVCSKVTLITYALALPLAFLFHHQLLTEVPNSRTKKESNHLGEGVIVQVDWWSNFILAKAPCMVIIVSVQLN